LVEGELRRFAMKKGEETTEIYNRFKTLVNKIRSYGSIRWTDQVKGKKKYPNQNKSKGKRSCFKCGKSGHFIAQCPNNDNY
jgi:hypothetical protein